MSLEQKYKVSIIIPTYNEQDSIGKVIDDVKAALDGSKYSYEILVIDDASTDGSASVAEKKGATVIKHTRNRGSGASRKTGIINAKGEIIVMLDADGTYTASDIPKMLEFFPQYDQVNGARTSEKGTLRILRVPAKFLIQRLASYLTDTKIPDLNTGLKAFKRDIMLKYLWVIPDGFSCVTTMTLAFLINGYAVKYIPTEYHKRVGSPSKFHPVRDTYKYLETVIRIVMYFNPLKIFLPVSLTLFFTGVIKAFYDVLFTVHQIQASTIIIIMTSVIIGTLGLMADLIVVQTKREIR